MIPTVLAEVTGQLDKRFLLNAFFPTLLFSLLAGAVATADAGGVAAVVESWEQESGAVRVLVVIGWVAAVFVVANLVANGIMWITRLFEGYNLPAFVRDPGRAHQKHRYEQITGTADVIADKRQRSYPVHPSPLGVCDFAPTRLGNVLKSAETYPEARYGVQSTRTWPRLYHLLPEELRTSLAEARASMEFMLVVAFFATLFAPLASLYLMLVEAPIGWVLACLLGGAAVATVAYRGALTPAAVYGNQVRASYDGHRFLLLEALQAPLPASVDEERLVWEKLTRFLVLGDTPRGRYVRGA